MGHPGQYRRALIKCTKFVLWGILSFTRELSSLGICGSAGEKVATWSSLRCILDFEATGCHFLQYRGEKRGQITKPIYETCGNLGHLLLQVTIQCSVDVP